MTLCRYISTHRIAAAMLLAAILAPARESLGHMPDPWRQYASPAEAGWSAEKLAKARAHAEQIGAAAVFVVHDGHVLVAWGDVERPFKCHSVRKSFVSALYGPYVADGTIDLEATIGELNIDDQRPLTDAEKQARIIDLLRSRSGIYHPAAKETSGHRNSRPERGSHAPGSHFWYNNWDFNLLGVIFNQLTDEDLFEAFKRRIADPIGMQDYDLEGMHYELAPSLSNHPAYAFRMSARDAARFGWLICRDGEWDGNQVIPAEWVDTTTSWHSETAPGRGYGYCWWVYPTGGFDEDTELVALNRHDKFAAVGTGGQIIMVIPESDFVFVHRGDTDNNRHVGGGDVWRLAEMILAAKTAEPVDDPQLVALDADPLPGAMPAPDQPETVAVDHAILEDYIGVYDVQPGVEITIQRFQGRMFASMTGEGEVEILPASETRFFGHNQPITIEFKRSDDGRVDGLVVDYAGRTIPAAKRD